MFRNFSKIFLYSCLINDLNDFYKGTYKCINLLFRFVRRAGFLTLLSLPPLLSLPNATTVPSEKPQNSISTRKIQIHLSIDLGFLIPFTSSSTRLPFLELEFALSSARNGRGRRRFRLLWDADRARRRNDQSEAEGGCRRRRTDA